MLQTQIYTKFEIKPNTGMYGIRGILTSGQMLNE